MVMNVVDNLEVDFLAFALDVRHLATDHAVRTQQARQDFNRLRIAGTAHQFERLDTERIARHHGRRFAELLVARKLAAAVVVVIDARKVVMDKAERVEHFKRTRRKPNLVARAAKHIEGSLGETGTQALAARKHRIAHSLVQSARAVRYRREVFIKFSFRFFGDAGEIILGNSRLFFNGFHTDQRYLIHSVLGERFR